MTNAAKVCLIALIALPACGEDPVLEAAREEASSSSSSSGGNARGSGPSGGTPENPPPGDPSQPGAGIPEEPAPGDPNVPPPEGGVKPHDDGTIPPPEGAATILLKGTIEIPDYQGGKITIDVFDGDQSIKSGKRPDIVGRATFDGPGAFEMEVIADTPIWLSAYADQDENGRPSKEDPMGPCDCNPVKSDEDVTGVVLELGRGTPPK